MKLLRNVLLAVLGLVLVLTLVAFLLPRTIHVERSAQISAPPAIVYLLLTSPKVFNEWSPWMKMDPNIKIDYFGPAAGIGAGYHWNSVEGDLGTGTWTIIGVDQGKQVNISLQMSDMEPALSKQMVEASGSGSKVTWTLDSDMGMNPFMRWMGLLMNKLVGSDFEQGLAEFDKLAKKKSTGRIEKIEQATEPPSFALTVRKTIAVSELSSFFARSFMGIVSASESKIVGAPFAIYHRWSKDSTDVEAGMPVELPAISNDPYMARVLSGGPIVRASYYGPYEGTEAAHNEIYAYIQKNGLTITGSPWEVYLTDPGTEPDPSRWLTYICYPVSTTTTP